MQECKGRVDSAECDAQYYALDSSRGHAVLSVAGCMHTPCLPPLTHAHREHVCVSVHACTFVVRETGRETGMGKGKGKREFLCHYVCIRVYPQ